MGVIEGTYITLTNYKKKKVEDLERGDKLLSCEIQGLKPLSHSNIAMSWTKKDPTILKGESSVKYTSTNSVAIYRIINDKLAISLDHVIFTKDGETDECSWNNVKSLRRGDFIFNESYEFEEITSLKKIKEDSSTIVLSLSGYPYYFANGYLIHNVGECEDCNICKYWKRIITPYGPHTWNSSAACVGGHANLFTQSEAYSSGWSEGFPVITPDDGTGSGILHWNNYTATLEYNPTPNAAYHYLYKDVNGWKITINVATARNKVTRTFASHNQSYYTITNSANANAGLEIYYTGDGNGATGAWYGPWTENSTTTTTTPPTAGGNPLVGLDTTHPDWPADSSAGDFKMYYKLHPDCDLYQFRIYSGDGNTQREPASGWANIKKN